MKTIVHVNQHVLRANARTSSRDPALTVKTYKDNRYAHAVEVLGPARLVYSPDRPLSCGARVWLETQDEVVVLQDAACALQERRSTRIEVSQMAIRTNIGAKVPMPVLTVRTKEAVFQAYTLDIEGPCRVVYGPDSPHECGAHVWIDTDAAVATVASRFGRRFPSPKQECVR